MSPNSSYRYQWLKAVNRSDLLPRAKLVASALAVEFYNQDTGRCDPGAETLATATGQTLDTVKRAIRDLVEAGWLARSEGRGRGNKTQFDLLSPGKVIPISSAKKGAPVHHRKGGTDAPLPREKGAPVREKGGTGALSYNKDKHTIEHRGARVPTQTPEPVLAFKDYRFAGKAIDGPSLVPMSDHATLNAYADLVRSHGLPDLQAMAIRQATKKEIFFHLPYRKAPNTPEQNEEVLSYFRSIIDHTAVRYAAQ